MFYLNLFKKINNNKAFLVVPYTIKKAIIKIKTKYELKHNILFKFKVVTTNELVELFSFSVDSEIYLNNLENNDFTVSLTKELINFARYDLSNKSLELTNFKKENKRFININKGFIDNLPSYSFYIIGPSYLLDPFINYYNLKVESINPFNNQEIDSSLFLRFNEKEDEIFYIMEQISSLIDNNIDINNIFIANAHESDYTVLNKLSSFYNIPIITNNKVLLINIPYINKLMSLEYKEILNLLSNK